MLRKTVNKATMLCVRNLPASSAITVQTRNEYILRRMHPPKLGPEGEMRPALEKPEAIPGITHSEIDWVHVWDRDRERFLKTGDEYVYIEEHNTDDDPVGDVEVILCWDIDGIGRPGDCILVNKDIVRHQLIPFGAAVYNTKENAAKMEKVAKEAARKRELEGDMSVPESYDKLVKMLDAIKLPIPMNLDADWVLNKKHLQVAFRLQGIYLLEENITLPEDEITIESEFEVLVTLFTNGGKVYTERPVQCVIVDKISPLARTTPFAKTFEYRQLTITELVLKKYYQMYPEKRPVESELI